MFVLLVNLLIAMMGDTYTKIAEIKNEWMRQVFKSWFYIIFVYSDRWFGFFMFLCGSKIGGFDRECSKIITSQ